MSAILIPVFVHCAVPYMLHALHFFTFSHLHQLRIWIRSDPHHIAGHCPIFFHKYGICINFENLTWALKWYSSLFIACIISSRKAEKTFKTGH
jgi:hypothetical protein